LNQENVYKGHIVAPLDTLQKIIKAAPAHIAFLSKEDKICAHLVGGDLVLDTYNVEEEKFVCSDKTADLGSVSSQKLYATIKDLGGVVAASVAAPERRIVFDGGNAYANHMWAIVRATGDFPDMDLKVKDIGVLKVILANLDEDLSVFATKDSKVTRKGFRGKTFTYMFLTSDVAVSSMLKNSMVEVLREDSVFVDLIQLYKMVELSADLNYSTGRIGVNFDDDGNLIVGVRTKKSKDSNFKISGSKNANPKPLKEEVMLQAKLFKLILRSFAGSATVQVSLDSKGLGVKSDKYEAALYSEAQK
jgi:hypothetical protein